MGGISLCQSSDLLIINSFWYSPLYPRELSFPSACRKVLGRTISAITLHLLKKRPADILLDFTTKSSSILIVLLQELSLAFENNPHEEAAEVVSSYISRNPQSSLANILDEGRQRRKLELVADSLLKSYVDSSAYAFEPARFMLKNALAFSIFCTTLDTCAKAEWINGWIIYLLQDSKPELISALDSGMDQSLSGNLKESKTQWEINNNLTSGRNERQEKHQENGGTVFTIGQDVADQAAEEVQKLNAMIAEDEALRNADNSNAAVLRSKDSQLSSAIATNNSMFAEGRDIIHVDRASQPPTDNSYVEEQDSKQKPMVNSTFTDFTQLDPSYLVASSEGGVDHDDSQLTPFTLLNSRAAVLLDAVSAEKSIIRSKPTADFLIQIEPFSGRYLGWIVGRKYAAFETLHEILRRISVISGVAFNESHVTLPNWKGKTNSALSKELEDYLNDALSMKPLAESEGMRRFFEKTDVPTRVGQGKTSFTLESVGRGVKDVFSKAPKEVTGGGKAFIGGMSGVLGGVGGLVARRVNDEETTSDKIYTKPNTNTSQKNIKADQYLNSSADITNATSNEEALTEQHEYRFSNSNRNPGHRGSKGMHLTVQAEGTLSGKEPAKASQLDANERKDYSLMVDKGSTDNYTGLSINLPPPPSNISDNYVINDILMKNETIDSMDSSKISTFDDNVSDTSVSSRQNGIARPKSQREKVALPLTIEEAQIILELIFADINELYTLSSAWNFRKTLLNAAKAFLLRPGNVHMEKIRSLLQKRIIDENTSDEAIATHIQNLRRATIPTDDASESYAPQVSMEDKMAQRREAKRLLIERGMPQALIGVMGAVASKEALSKIFDCLQLENVARGLMFGLLLQILQILA